MPPKKGKGPAVDPDDPSMNPEAVVDNYKKYCKLAALAPHPKVLAQLGGDEEQLEIMMKNEQLVVDGEPSLGPHGTRALCTALMGNAPGMSGAVFKMAKNFRFWRMDCSDDGAACLAEILRLGGAELPMAYLELLDCGVGYRGAHALGQSLMCGQNRSLLTLKLDYNSSLGSDGCRALCQGLRTNATLKQLHLCYCGLDEDAGQPLGEVLSYAKTTLQKLHLQGNKMRGGGLSGTVWKSNLRRVRPPRHRRDAGSMVCPWGSLTVRFGQNSRVFAVEGLSAPDSLVDLRTGRESSRAWTIILN